MASIQLTINSNGAFDVDAQAEAVRIIRVIADRVEKGERRFSVDDNKGNRAARVKALDIPGGRRGKRR